MKGDRTRVVGATIVTPAGAQVGWALTVSSDSGRIVAIGPDDGHPASHEQVLGYGGRLLVPGFVDAHVHGVLGTDVLDGPGAVERVALALPQYGVTAFAPTSVACSPTTLDVLLTQTRGLRATRATGAARVLGAHLESNFINPDYAGAQPRAAIRLADDDRALGDFSGADILRLIRVHAAEIAVITIAPERPGGLALARELQALGIRVSIGHSGATFDEAMAAFGAGVHRATHLGNAMPPFSHRAPGLFGAALTHPDVTVELIGDGVHVHPAMLRIAIATKGVDRVVAISDGTGASGLPRGAKATLAGRTVTAADTARFDDGALAGSVATMASVFRVLVDECGVSIADAVKMCATNPARDLGFADLGRLEPGAEADFVVLGPDLAVEETWIAGTAAWKKASAPA